MAATAFYKLWTGYKDGQENDEVKAAWKRLCKRNYHLHCTIQNNTDQRIYFDSDYFNSGSMFIPPPDEIGPRSNVTFGVGGGSYSGDALRSAMMGAVSGGAKFHIGGCNFAVGFTDPIIGSRKAGVAVASNAKAGYDAVSSSGNTVTSDGYRIVASIDSDGRKATYRVEKI
ncbi:hypothetical protein M422DRAFT_47754 [Sphaerobolus stellatus SS14]|uniref:Uncharacterized protein n=1 Tax=Sphaerobolus stellatus (strain SS14) TaxID=990650 RepID=A0A0C9UKP8_SPHS4|nr:hypothetical protein M422DRAFT_36346 [Sphaerobolus stellatus SS14]KIJ43663.1 hypothetical protein M422DRAFT_47754 [Sphaerobolus stellatus SS14]